MKTMTIPSAALDRCTIPLGRQGDNGALEIAFDVRDWLTDEPGGRIEGYATPPSGSGYPLALTMRDGMAVWTVRAGDTAQAGRGRVQIALLGADGMVLHSAIGGTQVLPSIAQDAGGTPPEAAEPWFEELARVRDAAQTAAGDANTAAVSANEAAQAAEQAASTADAASNRADDAAGAANTAAGKANTAAGGANTAAKAATDAAGAANAAAEKIDGMTATAEALPAGSAPTVQITDDGQRKQIAFGIPRGAPGEPGKPGKDGAPGAPGAKGEPGRDGKDAPQIDDEIVAATNPWSSLKTVDALCPPIDVTGNPVVCEPIENYPLQITASWVPKQEGAGDPSPENIRPIHGMDSVTIVQAGRNLLNPALNAYNTYKPYGLTITYIGDNRVRLTGTYNGTNGSSFVIIDTTQKWLAGKELKITGFTENGTEQRYRLYGLRTEAETVIAMIVQFDAGNVIDMTVAIVVSQDTPTAYIPYTGQTTALALPRAIYGGEVDAATGQGAETWGYIAAYAGEPILGEWISDRDVYAPGTTPTTGAQVAYKLADPVPFTATGGQKMPAISDVNTIITDADSVRVVGRADPVRMIGKLAEHVAALENAAIAP